MLASFALHPETDRLALLRTDADGRPWIELRTLAGDALGEIGANYLPLGPRWSPDGAALAFYSNDGLLYLYRLGAAAPQPIFTHSSLQAGFCQWEATGSRLVFSAYDAAKQTPPNIYTLEVETGRVLQLTDDARTVDRFPHISPSGQRVAFQRQYLDEAELPTRVHVVDAQSGDCFQVPGGSTEISKVSRRCWSPDSSSLLVTVEYPTHYQVKVIRVEDGAITWSYESDLLQRAVFSPQGDHILCVCTGELLWFSYPEGTLLQRLSLDSFSEVRPSLTGPRIDFGAQASAVYFLGQNSHLYRWTIGGACVSILEESQPVKPAFNHESYMVPSRDGRLIPVQRFIPPRPRRPAVLFVHGGPGEAIDPNDPFMLRLLAEGFEFVCAAYRGSSGYGSEHQEANRGEYGRADVWDVVAAGFDWKKRAGEDRPLLLAGYSYGAFLTLLALAQEQHPWAGGIVMWALSGLHRLGLHQHRAFPSGADAKAAAKIERAPLEQARHIRGPLLIFHGALDTTATTGEMKSIQNSIRNAGGACELIVYPDDTHALMRHRDEIHAAVLRFLERFQ